MSFLMLNEVDAYNDEYRHYRKFYISEDVSDYDMGENSVRLKSLIPPAYMVGQLINFKNRDMFYEDYKRYISNDEIFPNIVIIAYSVINYDTMLVCSNMERTVGYMDFLEMYLHERYNIKSNNSNIKLNNSNIKLNNIGRGNYHYKSRLMKDIDICNRILNGDFPIRNSMSEAESIFIEK